MLHFFIGSLADWTGKLAPILGREDTFAMIEEQYTRLMPAMYAKPCEEYCREVYPDEAEKIFERAEKYYLNFMKDMPDLGKNMMADNMLDWFTIISFYEASDHRLDGETLLKAEVMHAKLIRTKTEALGGDCCDYWYVGDKSPMLEQYKNLKEI